MADTKKISWLEKLDERINIDIDWMDTEYIKTLSFKPNDQTSNQLWLGMAISSRSNENLLRDTVKALPRKDWLSVYSRIAAILCTQNLSLIKGRVLVQTSPSYAYDTEKILEHARLYDEEFQRLGVPRSRFCIKILATGPGVNAAKTLQREGIETLGTGVFSAEQAIACSQAGCLFISPYYNEVRTAAEPSLWPNVADPAKQHPFSNRIFQMIEIYKQLAKATGKRQPLVKNAAFRSIKEVIATAELGCHSATVSPQTMDELGATEYDPAMDFGVGVTKADEPDFNARTTPERLQDLLHEDPLTHEHFTPALIDVDYLADNGAELERALDRDPPGASRLNDAIALFIQAESQSKDLIEKVMHHQSSL